MSDAVGAAGGGANGGGTDATFALWQALDPAIALTTNITAAVRTIAFFIESVYDLHSFTQFVDCPERQSESNSRRDVHKPALET